MLRTRLFAALRRTFPRADSATFDTLAEAAAIVALRRGEILYRQGDAGSSMHLVLRGRLAVRVGGSGGRQRLVAYLEEGECVGEMALLTAGRRSATVVAARDTTLAVIDGETFRAATAGCPQAVLDLAQAVIGRLVAGQQGATPQIPVKHVAVFPLRQEPWVDEFAHRLQIALMHFGTTRLLYRRSAEFAQWDVGHLLEDCERQYNFVVSVGDAEPSEWTRYLAGHADRILLLASSGWDPALSPIEQLLGAPRDNEDLVPLDLVLVHFDGAPVGTERWLESRTCDRHHHIAWKGNTGFHRLARALSGHTITLVLSGGGARGFAHAGAVRALREAGVPIDAVGGTSFGGLVGAAVALGRSDEEMIESARRVFLEGGLLDDYTVPLVSVVRGHRMEELLRQTFGEAEILDAWIPFFAVSANLSRNSIELHQRGPFWRALRATVSLPGIFPPAVSAGELLVDGGLLNNFPVDIMKEIVPGRAIAVDLSLDDGYRFAGESIPSPFELFLQRLRGENRWIPTLGYVLMKATTLSSAGHARAARSVADLCLAPPVGAFDMLDWSRLYEIVEAGYRYTQRVLDDWLPSHPDWVQPHEIFDSRALSRWNTEVNTPPRDSE